MTDLVDRLLPDCPCERCNPQTDLFRRFTMCPDCGNKRCPKGTDHDLDCTGSNEPGQTGSSWAGFAVFRDLPTGDQRWERLKFVDGLADGEA